MADPNAGRRCNIPARTLPPCDLEWGHTSEMHANAGDGFYAPDFAAEHRSRQTQRSMQLAIDAAKSPGATPRQLPPIDVRTHSVWRVNVTATVDGKPRRFTNLEIIACNLGEALRLTEDELERQGAELETLREWTLRTSYMRDGKAVEIDARIDMSTRRRDG